VSRTLWCAFRCMFNVVVACQWRRDTGHKSCCSEETQTEHPQHATDARHFARHWTSAVPTRQSRLLVCAWGRHVSVSAVCHSGLLRVPESPWKSWNNFSRFSRPGKSLKTDMVLESPWISVWRSLKVLEFDFLKRGQEARESYFSSYQKRSVA